jgi:hypothetical protein
MFKIIRSKEASKIALITGSIQNLWSNLNNVRCEATRHFRNKNLEYLKSKINELGMNSNKTNIRDSYKGMNEFKRGHKPSCNVVKNENGDLLADSYNILNRWKDYFSQYIRSVLLCRCKYMQLICYLS